MSKQTATTPFYTSENKVVTLHSDGKRRTMRIHVASDVHTMDVSSLPKDALRNLADDVEAMLVWAMEKTRATEHKRHGRELLRAYTSMSEDE